ncbi:MAG: transcription antitermination factor NusB [Bacteroidia bacterium]|nr:transcription antitermination factor NusB [Bacteroidia bacterium]
MRIKVFQALYAITQDNTQSLAVQEKNLIHQLEKTRELFFLLLNFGIEFKHFCELELDTAESRYIRDKNLENQLKTIINNQYVDALNNSTSFKTLVEKKKLNWVNNKDLFKHLLSLLKSNPTFSSYLDIEVKNFNSDKTFFSQTLELFISESEMFNSYLEERYMNWEDDQVLIVSHLHKIIQQAVESSNYNPVTGSEISEEDSKFVQQMLHLCNQHEEDFTALISHKTQNWDPERLAIVDLLLMRMALCEMLYFPYVPVKVSINEYIELAKLYSTPNSHGFINGILDKLHLELKEENKIVKLGRGLVE